MRINEWYTDAKARGTLDGDAAVEDTGKRRDKKAKKGGAMEMALRAFVDRWGWEKGEAEVGPGG